MAVLKGITLIFISLLLSQYFNRLTLPSLNESDQHFFEETICVADFAKAIIIIFLL